MQDKKNPVKDYDSLTGMSKDNGSTVSESHVTKSTFCVDDESIIETGRGKRNRKKKKRILNFNTLDKKTRLCLQMKKKQKQI